MSRKKAIFLYLLGTLGQIWLISIIVFVLRHLGMVVDYRTPMGMLAIGIGGLSTALWGTIIAVRYKKYSTKKILRIFRYKAKQGQLFICYCVLVFGFLLCCI